MLRAAALAVAALGAFFGVMYLRFSSDTVPAPEATPSPAVARVSLAERCERYSRIPKPPQCEPGAEWVGRPIPPPTPAPPPTALGGVRVVPLEVGPKIELPDDIALIVPSNCRNCPGPWAGLSRIYRDPAGQMRVEDLVTLEELGLAPASASSPGGAIFNGFVADQGGSTIAVNVCRLGPCFQGPGPPSPGQAETAIFRSDDGGVSWSELPPLSGVAFLHGVLPDGRILVGVSSGKPEPPVYEILPGGERLAPPKETVYGGPLPLGNGEIVWPIEFEGFVRSDGSRWLGEWADPARLYLGWKAVLDPAGQRFIAEASTVSNTGPGSGLIVVFRTDGSLEQVFSPPGYFSPVAWLDGARVLGHVDTCAGNGGGACSGYGPAVLDLEGRLIHHLSRIAEPSPIFNVIAVQRGPFARVVNTDNTCLYIRAAPLLSAGILDCAAEGVLLRDTGETGGPAGEWLRVVTPGGAEGWASAQYLER